MKTDAIDMKIIHRLWDGRTPFKDIAEDIGITTNTVRSRVNRLRENGVLQIIGLVDPSAIHGTYSALIFFDVKPEMRQEIMRKIGALERVIAAACLSSKADITAVVMFNESFTPRDFLFEELKGIEGIESVEIATVVDAVNWQLRYTL